MAKDKPWETSRPCWGFTKKGEWCKIRVPHNKWFCGHHRFQYIKIVAALFVTGFGGKVLLSLFGFWADVDQLADNTGEELQAGQVQIAGDVTNIKLIMEEFSQSSKFKTKYPLGHMVFYADGSTEIRRVGGIPKVTIDWEKALILPTTADVKFRFSVQARVDETYVGGGSVGGTLTRRVGQEVSLMTLVDSVEVVLEIVQNEPNGVVGVIGLRPGRASGAAVHLGPVPM